LAEQGAGYRARGFYRAAFPGPLATLSGMLKVRVRVLPGCQVLAIVMMLGLGCASRQWVPLDLGPGAVELYVNGDRAEEVPAEIELRADRDHKLYV